MWIETDPQCECGGALINLADARSIHIVRHDRGCRLVVGYPGGTYVDLTTDLSDQTAWRVHEYLIAAIQRGDVVIRMDELVADAYEPELEALQNATARD